VLLNSITRAISGLLFGHDELDEMRKYMKLAIAAATHNKLQKQVHYTNIQTSTLDTMFIFPRSQ
jgi:hypothetical protein